MTQTVTLGGNPIQICGTLPTVGSTAPAFSLVVKSGICCKISLNRLMTYGLRTARHREDIAERVG